MTPRHIPKNVVVPPLMFIIYPFHDIPTLTFYLDLHIQCPIFGSFHYCFLPHPTIPLHYHSYDLYLETFQVRSGLHPTFSHPSSMTLFYFHLFQLFVNFTWYCDMVATYSYLRDMFCYL